MRLATRVGLLLAIALGAVPGSALGHALDVVAGAAGTEAVVLAARYPNGAPASGARFSVYGPGESAAHQRGRTDAAGRIAFVPDRSGSWRIVVDDDLGHRVETNVSVDLDDAASARWALEEARGGTRPFVGLVAGLALIAALTGLAYVLRARKSSREKALDA